MTAVTNGEGDGENDKEVISVLLTAGATVNMHDEVSSFQSNKHARDTNVHSYIKFNVNFALICLKFCVCMKMLYRKVTLH